MPCDLHCLIPIWALEAWHRPAARRVQVLAIRGWHDYLIGMVFSRGSFWATFFGPAGLGLASRSVAHSQIVAMYRPIFKSANAGDSRARTASARNGGVRRSQGETFFAAVLMLCLPMPSALELKVAAGSIVVISAFHTDFWTVLSRVLIATAAAIRFGWRPRPKLSSSSNFADGLQFWKSK